ncbi:MAG: methionyl-tRNA formyltransferase [Bacteroidaceae bacterium]|nr:methionyl-tRNA formyltransferase [Bacteroidaceae bacterium]
MQEPLRIIFMGTPEFAVESLSRLVEAGCNVVAVVTMPDKAIGRHHDTLQPSPVKQYAVAKGIPVLQPERLRDEAFVEQLRALRADLQVVVAFRMLPEVVWAMPPLGTFNLHAALLPQYRGAAPINWAVINGETQTGVTTFFLDHDIDTGRIIHRVAIDIGPADTAGDVHDRLMHIGADLVVRTVRDIEAGTVAAVPQEQLAADTVLHPAPKLFRENTELRWSRHTAATAANFVRGLAPYPTAWTTLLTADGRRTQLKLFAATADADGTTATAAPGTIATDGAVLRVATAGGWLRVAELQLAGKRRMAAADFLRGARLDGARMEETPQ